MESGTRRGSIGQRQKVTLTGSPRCSHRLVGAHTRQVSSTSAVIPLISVFIITMYIHIYTELPLLSLAEHIEMQKAVDREDVREFIALTD